MLYVFHVDAGNMLTFDMNLALDSVASLKESIWLSCRIPMDRQVLLVSGGECLNNSETRVCNYAAGTDTNPIFLFNRDNIEGSPASSGQQPLGSNENLADLLSMREQVESCLKLPPTYKTVVSRASLAQQLCEMARDLSRRCEQVIHDQHLQHQGWLAVVANSDDIATAFATRLDSFSASFDSYKNSREERDNILQSFSEDVSLLAKVDLVGGLESGEITLPSTLLDWIQAQDSSNNLESVGSSCLRLINKLDIPAIEGVEKEARSMIEVAGMAEMKQIKGLESRLYGLDQLLLEINTIVQEQYDLAQAFAQNQNRASDLRDTSILPDLCQSHQHQLLVMSRNHERLEDIRRRCGKAKEELNTNLIARLKWVMMVQQKLNEAISRLNVFSENLKRIQSQLNVINQIHIAKEVYGEALAEVFRRQAFTSAYLSWANGVADRMDKVYKSEVSQRKVFGSKFENHFVSRLFPGLSDFPSPFANERPAEFDRYLPKISIEDVGNLESVLSITLESETPEFFPPSSSPPGKERESVELKKQVERLENELLARGEELDMLESTTASKLSCLQEEVQELHSELDCEKRLRVQLMESHEEGIVEFQDKLSQMETRLLTTQQLLASREKCFDVEREVWRGEENRLREDVEKQSQEFMDKLQTEKDAEIKEIRDKARTDVEGLKSRYRFIQTMEHKSTDNVDRSLDSIERLPKTEDLAGELYRTIELIQKSSPDGISPKLIRKIVSRLSPSSETIPTSFSRVRTISESGQRQSIEEMEEEQMKSFYGLDTAVEAACSLTSPSSTTGSATSSNTKEFNELTSPTPRISCVSAKLLEKDQITTSSCKAGDNVFIYWNNPLQSYIVSSTLKNLHFLHTECLKAIGHTEDNPVEAFTANVVDKEFCVARRAQNRYRVPQGFHFYRVRVKLLEILNIDSFLP